MDKKLTKNQIINSVLEVLKSEPKGAKSIAIVNNLNVYRSEFPDYFLPRVGKDKRSKIQYQVAWILSELKKNGIIERDTEGKWFIKK